MAPSLGAEAPHDGVPGTPQAPGVRSTSPFGLSSLPAADSGIDLPPESEPAAEAPSLPGDFGAMGNTFGSGAEAVDAPAPRRAPVELPPDLLSSSRMSAPGPIEYASSSSSGVRPRLVLVLLVGLALVASLATLALKGRRVEIPTEAVDKTDRAAVLLRRDDTASREQAIQRLREVIGSQPRYVEAHAELAVALALNLSDLQADAERLRTRSEAVARARETAQTIRDPAERALRRSALQRDQDAIARDMAPLRASIETVRKELDAQMTLLGKAPETESTSAAAARLKAQALYASVLAAPDSLGLAERLRKGESAPHLWSTVARAEYALSASSPPDTLMSAAKDLEVLRQADSSLLRAYLLGARVALRLRDTATARSLLDDALALNPGHQVAKRLIEQIDSNVAAP
ncbi:hypothetical protein [Myxococcus sp. Y35]|uniref:hypothetical protein n=1 Tax=Pseudomyxococcus flavus TaxID=3115648 RepID=UPI003CEEF986